VSLSSPRLSFFNALPLGLHHDATSAVHLRRLLLKVVGLGFPMFHGTGIMISSVGLLPYQGPIHVVVGAPIPVPKLEGDIASDEGRRCAAALAWQAQCSSCQCACILLLW
jgi:hypothetical protein